MSDFTIHLNAPQAQALLDVVGQIISKGLCTGLVANKIAIEGAQQTPVKKKKGGGRSKGQPLQATTTDHAKKIVRKRKVPTSTDKALHEIGSDTNLPS